MICLNLWPFGKTLPGLLGFIENASGVLYSMSSMLLIVIHPAAGR